MLSLGWWIAKEEKLDEVRRDRDNTEQSVYLVFLFSPFWNETGS